MKRIKGDVSFVSWYVLCLVLFLIIRISIYYLHQKTMRQLTKGIHDEFLMVLKKLGQENDSFLRSLDDWISTALLSYFCIAGCAAIGHHKTLDRTKVRQMG